MRFIIIFTLAAVAFFIYVTSSYQKELAKERAACEARGGYLMVNERGPNVCIDRKTIK